VGGDLVKALHVGSRVLFMNGHGGQLGIKYDGQQAVITMRMSPDNNIRFGDGQIIWAESSELTEVTE
jgi:hypothetical protein